MSDFIIQYLLLALIPTILIEYVVLRFLRERRMRVLASSVIVNILTNVPLNLYVIHINDSPLALLTGEVLVFLFEALWYYLFLRNLAQSIAYSFLCNATSFLMGLLFQLLFQLLFLLLF